MKNTAPRPTIHARKWYIDRVKQEHGIRTDAELAESLHIGPATLARIRAGHPVGAAFIAGMLARYMVPCEVTPDGLYYLGTES